MFFFKSEVQLNLGHSHIATQQFRIEATSLMFRGSVKLYCDNYLDIMNCTFQNDLLSIDSEASELYNALKEFAKKHVYIHPRVLMLEIVGSKVIHGLLDTFIPAITSQFKDDPSKHEGKIYQILSPALRCLIKKYGNIEDTYQQLQLVTDFVSGMTDTYAFNLYQNLTGIKLEFSK